MCNLLIRWMYDKSLTQIAGRADFREPANNTEVHLVLTALALTTRWMNEHPGCGVAAWLMSGIITEEDYKKAGMSHLVDAAHAAMHDPELTAASSEYARCGGLWDTRTMFLMNQVNTILAEAGRPTNAAEVEKVLGQIPWLRDSNSAARKRWTVAVAQKSAAEEEKVPPDSAMASAGAQARRDELATIIENAHKKLKVEAKENEDKEARKEELVRLAAIESVRQMFAKGSKPLANAAQEKIAKACKCPQTMAAGLHKDTHSLHPQRLKETLKRIAQDRAGMEKQLSKTSLTAIQSKSALDHLFGAVLPSTSTASSSSGSGGVAGGGSPMDGPQS